MNSRRYTAVTAPFGILYITIDNGQLVRIDSRKPTIADALRFDDHPLLRDAAETVRCYFEGHSTAVTLPCMESFSSFQKAVFDAVKSIPYGETRSLEAIARQIGRPQSSHAVDMLCRSNPLWLVIPTHRVLTTEHSRSPYLSAEEALRRMEQRYRKDGLTKCQKDGKLF